MSQSVQKIEFNGYSMYPFLRPGDILYAEKSSVEDMETGDIIVYFDGQLEKKVVHRVIRKDPIRIKGDNLTFYDDIYLKGSDIIGKVCNIERAGESYKINPLFCKGIALMSRFNCTPGIIKSHVFGKPIKWILSRIAQSAERRA